MSSPRINARVASFAEQVAAAGGSTRTTHDGHLAIYDRDGRFIVKLRGHGKRTGDDGGATGRSIQRQVIRRIAGTS
jgi:hypothetical protein